MWLVYCIHILLAGQTGGKEGIDQYLNKFVKTEENGDNTANLEGAWEVAKDTASNYWAHGLAAAATFDVAQVGWNKATGKFIDTQTGKEVKAGDAVKYIDENGNQKAKVLTADDLDGEQYRNKRGFFSERATRGWEKFGDIKDYLSNKNSNETSPTSFSTKNETTDSSQHDNADTKSQNTADKTQTGNPSKDSVHQTPPEKSSNNQIIPENQEGVNTKNNNFRQTAMDRYLTEKQTGLDLSNNKDLAEFNRLESYKGKDLDNLSDMEKNKLGLDSSAFSSAKLAILF